jgi:hypothetical protein
MAEDRDIGEFIGDTAKTSSQIAVVSSLATIRAVSYSAIPILQVVLMAGFVYGMIALPKMLIERIRG